MILEVTPDEFSEINDAIVAMPDSLLAAWMIEHYAGRCPDLRLGINIEVRVVGRIEVKQPRRIAKIEGFE
jgi:hypothetical protein